MAAKAKQQGKETLSTQRARSLREDYLAKQVRRLESRLANQEATIECLVHGERQKWTEFVECDVGYSALAASGSVGFDSSGSKVFRNSQYQVTAYDPVDNGSGMGRVVHLSIRRGDGAAVHDWRDLQRIKNEICGRQTEGIELYPAEKRLVDGANQYHLFVFLDGQVPVGFGQRLVTESRAAGIQQRPFDVKPDDITTATDGAIHDQTRKFMADRYTAKVEEGDDSAAAQLD